MESEEAKKELEKGKQVQRRKVWSMGHFAVLGRQQLGAVSPQSSVLASLTTTFISHIRHCIAVSRTHKNGQLE